MTTTRWAAEQDKNALIDFADYVFSKAHRPHDFQTLLPKLYGENGDGAAHHFLIEEDGKLLAMLMAYPVSMRIAGEDFLTLGVGTVSVHPRARGRGFLKVMLDAVDERARELNADFAVLGGQRQRYEHFGYFFGGMELHATLTQANVRHALRDADDSDIAIVPFLAEHVAPALALHASQPSFCERPADKFIDILRNWSNEPFAVLKGGEFAGFGAMSTGSVLSRRSAGELQLTDEALCPAVLKKLSENREALSLVCPPWHKERAALLSSICDQFSIVHNHSCKIYQPERLKAALKRLGSDADSFFFDGFTLPLPLFVASPDAV